MPDRPERAADVIEELEDLLAEGGTRAALRLLNMRAPHRFTGIYRFDPPDLRNLRLFDGENPEMEVRTDALMSETYCSVVGREGASFATADARADRRLREHPARESTLSYCGVLLRDEEGRPFGTLCHFDLVPRPVPSGEVPIMEAIAPRLYERLREELRDEAG